MTLADSTKAYALEITDNDLVLIASQQSSPVGRIHYASIGALSSWSHIDLTKKPGWGAASGNYAYFPENDQTKGVAHRTNYMIVVDCSSGTPSASNVYMTAKDSNIVCLSQKGSVQPIFCSPDHLFVPCNYTTPNTTDQTERPYLARLDLVTLDDAGGKFVGDLMYSDRELMVYNGRYFDGKLYLVMVANAYDGRVLIVDEDLTSATLYPPKGVPVPVNDDFAGALNLYANEPYSGNLFYGTTEAGEPVPTWASSGSYPWVRNNGHSVWFSFDAPATDTYTITAEAFASISIQVYTGTDVASLSSVVEVEQATATLTASLPAAAGVTYMISLRYDMTGGPSPSGFGGFAGTVPFTAPDAERFGRYTITIT